MVCIGNPTPISDLIPEESIPDIIQIVNNAWRSFIKPCQKENENSVTKRFYKILVNKRKSRKLPIHLMRFYNIPSGNYDEDDVEIDLAFVYGNNEDIFFAIECKRLHVTSKSGNYRADYSVYTGGGGMDCFISGRYVGKVKHGGMIAYVMDGKVEKAVKGVDDNIRKNKENLKIIGKNGFSKSTLKKFKKRRNILETNHNLDPGNFKIHHIFLAV